MNLGELRLFQSAINMHSAVDANARVGISNQEESGLAGRNVVLLKSGSSKSEDNTEVRRAFKTALTKAFNVSHLDELPSDVKKALKIGDFKESKDGVVASTRPLTMRRIRAVMGAVQNYAKTAASDVQERTAIDTAFASGLQDTTVVEDAFRRLNIASGRQPMKIQMPLHDKEVDVPLSALSAYTKGISAEKLPVEVDRLKEAVESDLKAGREIYLQLMSGRTATDSPAAQRTLRLYLSFAALANGKGLSSRVISVPDPEGRLAAYLNGKANVVSVAANDTITGSSARLMFVSDFDLPGAPVFPRTPMEVKARYVCIENNRFSSELLERKAFSETGMTVSQMYANVKAEFCRLVATEEDELRAAVEKEIGHYDDSTAAGRAEIEKTKARNDLFEYRCMLNEFLCYLQSDRADLDHPEFRIGDEVVLTQDEIAKFAGAIDADSVDSQDDAPIAPQDRRAEIGTLESVESADQESSAPTRKWIVDLIGSCGVHKIEEEYRDRVRAGGKRELQMVNPLMEGLRSFYICMSRGCVPGITRDHLRGLPSLSKERVDVPEQWMRLFEGCDKRLLLDLAWYIKSGCVDVDSSSSKPIWEALRSGVINHNLPESICRNLGGFLTPDRIDDSFSNRVNARTCLNGARLTNARDLSARAASAMWSFGTFDMGKILRYIKDCGSDINEISVEQLQRLSAIAVFADNRLEDAPLFIQRQTGKQPLDVTTDDLIRLFKLKSTNDLTDKGNRLTGAAKDVADILKGDKLPSMTSATGKDVFNLISAMRDFSEGRAGDLKSVDFLGQKVSFRLKESGVMVFNVAGLEFRASKTAREFVEMFEDDALGHVGQFGTHIVMKMLPQIRGAELTADPVLRSRSRELCLRFIKGAIGMDPSAFASVGTKELFKIAEGVADGRYRLHTGEVSERAVKTMLERYINPRLMTSVEAAEMCNALENLETVPVSFTHRVGRSNEDVSLSGNNVKIVHDFLSDVVIEENVLDFDKSRVADSGNPDLRVVGIMRKHVKALVAVIRDPSLLATFPMAVSGGFDDAFAFISESLSASLLSTASDEMLEYVILFLLDTAEKPQGEWASSVDVYVETAATNPMARTMGRAALLAALHKLTAGLDGFESRIDQCVRTAMGEIQEAIVQVFEGLASKPAGTSADPIWAMELEEIAAESMTDVSGGYGRFMKNVLSTYFAKSSIQEQRRMVASMIRQTDSESSQAKMLGGLFKGAGPLLQKMLQGVPPGALGAEMAEALQDVKSNLLPIPDVFVKAGLNRIIERSQGRIKSIEVTRSLGAASVGQAFLCRMVTDENPQGEECVVKLLRPTVKTAIAREREIFEAAAADVPGMSQTFAGQLARIMEELDFTLEASNINFGRNVYESPMYCSQKSVFDSSTQSVFMDDIHSMEVHPLATPTMDCLVLKKAPGETYDRYMASVREKIGEVKGQLNSALQATNIVQLFQLKDSLDTLYGQVLKRQKYLVDLTKKWVQEGLFGNGFYHGDLHAGNIMTDGKGLTVIDFGNATHLTDLERANVLKMITAAQVGWNDMFESSFRELLTDKGRADFDLANKDKAITKDLAEVLHRGSLSDIGMRISAALQLLQKHGIEVPGSIYNFNQCQMRLGGTVNEMCDLLDEISTLMSQMSLPHLEVPSARGGGVARPGGVMMRDLSLVVSQVMDAFGKNEEQLSGVMTAFEHYINQYDRSDQSEEFKNRLAEEFNDESLRGFTDWFIDNIARIPCRNLSNNQEAYDFGNLIKVQYANFKAVTEALERGMSGDSGVSESPEEILKDKLIPNIMVVFHNVKDSANIIRGLSASSQKPTSFLSSVGESISGSLYTVRTTLGNKKSLDLMSDMNARERWEKEREERTKESDRRVEAYFNANSSLSRLSMPDRRELQRLQKVVKESALHLHLPFDLPGIDGKTDWRGNDKSRKRVYEALNVVVKKLVSELESKNVLNKQTPIGTYMSAVSIAMQYLVDREGGLFEAFAGADSSEKQRILDEVNATNDNWRTEEEEEDRMHNQCVLAAVEFLFTGGGRIAAQNA